MNNKTLLNNGYTVTCPNSLRVQIERDEKEGITTIWENFHVGDVYYGDKDQDYFVKKIDHNLKIAKLEILKEIKES